MSKIKTGIIGSGFIGPAHIEALRRLGYVEVVAIADINDTIAKGKASKLNINKSYGDYRDLLENNEIDVVHICTPNHLHFPMVKQAISVKKHIVCEKPLALNSKEGKELMELLDKTDLIGAIHFNNRFYPLIQQARSMIAAGILGNILAINGSYQQDWLFYDTDYNWRLESEFSGSSRAVADIGSHWMDTIEYITGLRIEKVNADFCTFFPYRKKPLKGMETFTGKINRSSSYTEIKIDTEDYATVLLRFNGGAHGSFTANQMAAGRKNRLLFEIYGTRKSISWNSEEPNFMWIGDRDSENSLLLKDPSLLNESVRKYAAYPGGHTEGFPDTSKQLFNNVYGCILNGKKDEADFPGFKDGYRELVICDAIVKSSKTDNWVNITIS